MKARTASPLLEATMHLVCLAESACMGEGWPHVFLLPCCSSNSLMFCVPSPLSGLAGTSAPSPPLSPLPPLPPHFECAVEGLSILG